MRISLIVAAARNGVIGRGGRLPWHLPEDMRRFRAHTLGHHVIMGRRTHESIGRPLPGRTNLVLSRDPRLRIEGCTTVHSLEEALDLARNAGEEEAFVMGGRAVYEAALPHADRIHLTRVEADVEGDVRLPVIDPTSWAEVAREAHLADERHAYAFSFLVLERQRPTTPAETSA